MNFMSYISIPRKITVLIIEFLIKILWALDKVFSLEWKYISKLFLKIIIFLLPLSFLGFIVFGIFSGYIHNLVVAYLTPEYNPLPKTTYVLYPLLVGTEPKPEITALSALVVDKKTGKVLFEKNSSESLPPASTVKLMTALVALEIYDLDEEVLVPKECTEVESSKIGLPQGKKFKVRDLISSMLIGSAGDSACTLAVSKIGEGDFVQKMNEKALQIGMSSTLFSNPIGLDNINGGHHTTVLDLYKLSSYVMSNPIIKDTVKEKTFTFQSSDGTGFTVVNTNRLLWDIPNTVGVKTGTTQGAGEVLIYEYSDGPEDIFILVMGSRNRFGDTKSLLEWVSRNYRWK